ncbi:hypothetical protein [Streptomyces sp. ISL-11]|uniref:hypothetical protein n=1 Tax=Streptomyces sp. ISL-11 TaxID=2819174 RepID=UPI001BE85868|nr:hypothetical protein [Streptomyces sp. ISL-11]MBT2387077.1 hypothetical protein [Streptomyces sp. ISL-11]
MRRRIVAVLAEVAAWFGVRTAPADSPGDGDGAADPEDAGARVPPRARDLPGDP